MGLFGGSSSSSASQKTSLKTTQLVADNQSHIVSPNLNKASAAGDIIVETVNDDIVRESLQVYEDQIRSQEEIYKNTLTTGAQQNESFLNATYSVFGDVLDFVTGVNTNTAAQNATLLEMAENLSSNSANVAQSAYEGSQNFIDRYAENQSGDTNNIQTVVLAGFAAIVAIMIFAR